MATIDSIINDAQSASQTGQAYMYSYAASMGQIVSSHQYVVPPTGLNFNEDSKPYSTQTAIPKAFMLSGLPALENRKAALQETDPLTTGLYATALNAAPGGFAFPVWGAPAQYTQFSRAPVELDIPPPPEFSAPSAPPAANLNQVSTAIAAPLPVQTRADITESALPDAPPLNLPAPFALPPPEVDFSVPSNSFSFVEQEYGSALYRAVKAALENDILNGGYGINPADEQLLWERARDREGAAYRETAEGIARDYAARGFPLASPALAALAMAAHDRMAGALGDINREILLKRSDLYVQARQFALAQGKDFETALAQLFGQRMERALNNARYVAEFALRFNDALRELVTLKLAVWNNIATVQAQQTDNAVKALEGYKAQYIKIEREDGRNKTRLEALDAANRAVLAMERIRGTQLAQIREEMNFEELKLKFSNQLTTNFMAQHQANETQFRAYREMVSAEVDRNEPVKLALDIYQAETAKAQAASEIEKDRFNAALAGHNENLSRHNQAMEQWLKLLAWALDRGKLLAEGGNQDALALQRLLIEQTQSNNASGMAEAELRVREFSTRWKQFLEQLIATSNSKVQQEQVSVEAARAVMAAMEGLVQASDSMILGVVSDVTQN